MLGTLALRTEIRHQHMLLCAQCSDHQQHKIDTALRIRSLLRDKARNPNPQWSMENQEVEVLALDSVLALALTRA